MFEIYINQIISLKKSFQSFFNEEFKELNLKSSEIKLIHILSFSKSESQAELSKKLECDKSHIHRIVIKLLMKKIIYLSNKNEINCRNIQIMLTDHGENIANIINKKLKDWQLKLIKGISKEELETTQTVLQKLVVNMKKGENND